MHRLLARQIRKHLSSPPPPGTEALIAAIEATYIQHDEDRALLQRSMALSSEELVNANTALKTRADEHARAVATLKETVQALGFCPGASPDQDTQAETLLGVADLLAQQVRLRNEIEQQLSARETRLRMLMRSASDAILVVDGRTGMVIDANEAASRLLGYPIDTILTLHHTAVHPAAHREAYADGLRRIVAEKEAYSQGEVWVLHRDGREIPVDVTSTVQEVDGVVLVQGIFRDATQRRQHETMLTEARDDAEAASRLKSSLLANMSHELRTPLTAIIGFAEVVSEALADRGDADLTEYIHLISQGGERLLNTLNSVLEFARLEAGRDPLQPEPFDLHARLHSIVAFFSQQATEKGLAIRFESSTPAPCPVVLDPSGLERAVINLVSNAIKFTQRGEVRLDLAAEKERVQITVHDTGIGISPAFMERLFEEFEQESAGMSRRHEGSGLGLAITKRLVEMMGGAIAVGSEPGVGTWFKLDLPRVLTRPEPAPDLGYLRPVPPADALPADALPADALPADALPADALPADALPADALPAEQPRPATRVLLADAEPTTKALLRHFLPPSVGLVTTHPATLGTTLDAAVAKTWPSVIVAATRSADQCLQVGAHIARLAETHRLARPRLVWLTADAVSTLPHGIDAVLTRPITRGHVLDALADVFAE